MGNHPTAKIRAVHGPSILHKIAFRTGYQIGRIEQSVDRMQKKITMAKWAAMVVDFLGIKKSARLGWKGFKIKQKIDSLRSKKISRAIHA